MKKRFSHIAILLLFFGCTKEEITPREYPRVSTTEAVDISSGGVTFKAEVIFSNVEIKDHGFVWSDVQGPLVSDREQGLPRFKVRNRSIRNQMRTKSGSWKNIFHASIRVSERLRGIRQYRRIYQPWR